MLLLSASRAWTLPDDGFKVLWRRLIFEELLPDVSGRYLRKPVTMSSLDLMMFACYRTTCCFIGTASPRNGISWERHLLRRQSLERQHPNMLAFHTRSVLRRLYLFGFDSAPPQSLAHSVASLTLTRRTSLTQKCILSRSGLPSFLLRVKCLTDPVVHSVTNWPPFLSYSRRLTDPKGTFVTKWPHFRSPSTPQHAKVVMTGTILPIQLRVSSHRTS